VIVIGAGVIGASVAYHLARLGAKRVLVLDRTQIGAGTTSQSSGILRTHYSVRENVAMAQDSWKVFTDFANYLGDEDAASGLVKCGYLIASPDGPKLKPLAAALEGQRQQGIEVRLLDRQQAEALLPIADLHDAALIGYEPEAGFADAYLVATSFARAARRGGVKIIEGVEVQQLLVEQGQRRRCRHRSGPLSRRHRDQHPEHLGHADRAVDRHHHAGRLRAPHRAGTRRSAALHVRDAGLQGPGLRRHAVLPQLWRHPDAGERRHRGRGAAGPDNEQGDVSLDTIASVGAQAAERFPSFETAGLASSWTGVYDVTPDWNPVLGRLPGIGGLVVGYGFSGHGFKLSPAVGRVLAQEALGLTPDISLAPYALERFAAGSPHSSSTGTSSGPSTSASHRHARCAC
jgi:sarcosine oxidase subunit beta